MPRPEQNGFLKQTPEFEGPDHPLDPGRARLIRRVQSTPEIVPLPLQFAQVPVHRVGDAQCLGLLSSREHVPDLPLHLLVLVGHRLPLAGPIGDSRSMMLEEPFPQLLQLLGAEEHSRE